MLHVCRLRLSRSCRQSHSGQSDQPTAKQPRNKRSKSKTVTFCFSQNGFPTIQIVGNIQWQQFIACWLPAAYPQDICKQQLASGEGCQRTCLCACTDIITFGLWWQDVLCWRGLGEGIKGHSSWLCSKLTSAFTSHESKSEPICGSFGFIAPTGWHFCPTTREKNPTSLKSGAIRQRKDFNWKSLRKLIWVGCLDYSFTTSPLFILFFGVIPLMRSQDVRGKTSRGCGDLPS